MAIDKALFVEARKLIEAAENVVVVSHVGPDGDALGSVLGLGLALKDAGKAVQMVLSDGAPQGFEHLEGESAIVRKAKGPVDLVIGVDCGDLERLGNGFPTDNGVGINIDHHVTNTMFGKVNLVDAETVASSAQITEYLPEFGLKMPPAARDALLSGMLTDTLGFRTNNMNADALRTAAKLVEAGAEIQVLYERALLRRSFEAMRHWGIALGRLQREGRLIWTTFKAEDSHESGYMRSDDADLINMLAATEGAAMTLVFIEQEDKKQVKLSWRSRGDVDVATLATSFGGGGHRAASGATVEGKLEDVQKKVLAASMKALDESK